MTKQLLTKKIFLFLSNNCYEIFLVGLLLHLYGSIFFNDPVFYGKYIRGVNVFFLYFSATNSFFHRRDSIHKIVWVIIVSTLCLNLTLMYFDTSMVLTELRNISFLIFLSLALYYILLFLISPHRLDRALISASIAGYLLIIEIAVRLFLIFYLQTNSQVLSNINLKQHTNTFIDTVYFCTVTITSIGFGDILPLSHNAKMATALLGLTGQFYLVVIMGIMVSKFMSQQK